MTILLKRPGTNAQLDYTINWDDGYLGSTETLATSTWWISPNSTSEVTIVSHSNSTATATVVVTGGNHGKMYQLHNKVTTSNSPTRTDTRTVFLKVWSPF